MAKKKVKKDKLDFKFLTILLLIAFIVLLIVGSSNTRNIRIWNLEAEDGNPAYLRFEMRHNYPEERLCYADITLLQDDEVIGHSIRDIGKVEPMKTIPVTLAIQFPPSKTEYTVRVDCD